MNFRKLIFLGALFLLPARVFCAETLDAAQWRNVPFYDVASLSAVEESQLGKIVGVHFAYRSERLRHVKPNWFEASIWQRSKTARNGYSYLRVLVARNDLDAFKNFPVTAIPGQQSVLYGRVEKDPEGHYFFIHALGRRGSIGAGGRATIVW